MNCYPRLRDDKESVDVIKQPRLVVTKKKVAVEFGNGNDYEFGNLKVVQEIGTRLTMTKDCPILTQVSFR